MKTMCPTAQVGSVVELLRRHLKYHTLWTNGDRDYTVCDGAYALVVCRVSDPADYYNFDDDEDCEDDGYLYDLLLDDGSVAMKCTSTVFKRIL